MNLELAANGGVPSTWLNDAVKGFLGKHGEFDDYLQLSHLRVFVAQPPYLLKKKCAELRLGEEFHDLDDVRYLLRYLNISTVDEAMRVITQYFEESVRLMRLVAGAVPQSRKGQQDSRAGGRPAVEECASHSH